MISLSIGLGSVGWLAAVAILLLICVSYSVRPSHIIITTSTQAPGFASVKEEYKMVILLVLICHFGGFL
uniref:Putative secreted protein n=1 Tax=Anopheles darlingi TaxID=43151 RepID=A0A2M4DRS8_ANODA